jgi:hypothetical protein
MPDKAAGAVQGRWGIVAFWHRWRDRTRTRSELSALGSEAGTVAHDLGVDAGELGRLAGRSPESVALLHVRLDALGLAAVVRDEPAVMRDLERTCSSCCLKSACKRDLANEKTAPAVAAYCPNEPTFEALRPAN